jgi:hypothetical protein
MDPEQTARFLDLLERQTVALEAALGLLLKLANPARVVDPPHPAKQAIAPPPRVKTLVP